MKAILEVRQNIQPHWVGDGFPVRSLFSYNTDAEQLDPFLLLDYAGPHRFGPSDKPRGVEQHPHRGFETVTIVYEGELEHRDSGGNHGKIGAGDVQWMTAAAGVIHEEFHSRAFTSAGGTLEMVQLWVNLPSELKMSPPRYQELLSSQIPAVPLPSGKGTARIIAGQLQGTKGPAKTFTPIDIWDVRMPAGATTELSFPDGYTTALVVQKGAVKVNDAQTARGVELVVFDRQGTAVKAECLEDAMFLVLCGAPIGEPIAAQGPFVMNTRQEIQQAIRDYQTGRMGDLKSAT